MTVANSDNKILIFSGTTEGRILAEKLSNIGISATVCVATEYGKIVMNPMENITIHTGRLDTSLMIEMMSSENFAVVVDATHPYAVEVTKNIKQAAKELGLKYLRLKRNTKIDMPNNKLNGSKDDGTDNQTVRANTYIEYFNELSECIESLKCTEGNIMLTTGSKDLKTYIDSGIDMDRLYVRILPGMESLQICNDLGLEGRHIIAMHGPFSKELNLALIKQYDIKHLVTKESGARGGYIEKIDASYEARIKAYVISNPEQAEEAYDMNLVLKEIEKIVGVSIPLNISISLVGLGMGNIDTLTKLAETRILEADYIVGAKRLIDSVGHLGNGAKEIRDYYLAKDILPYLEELKNNENGDIRVTCLFSGDTGFYSGCTKLYQALTKAGYDEVEIIPGISSINYLAAKCGITWQDAYITSFHGINEDDFNYKFDDTFTSKLDCFGKVYTLLSGKEQLISILQKLAHNMNEEVYIYIGYELSYDKESIIEGTPATVINDISDMNDGLYSMYVVSDGKERN